MSAVANTSPAASNSALWLTGTDSTGRLLTYHYQRANVGSFGEWARHFMMRSDAKGMEAGYVPVLNGKIAYDPVTRDPLPGASYKPAVWHGFNVEANDHGSIHGHWELEVADANGHLQGRLEIPFIDQSKLSNGLNNTTFGIAYTNIRTNLADFSVRAQNITSGDYAGQNTALRVGGNNMPAHRHLRGRQGRAGGRHHSRHQPLQGFGQSLEDRHQLPRRRATQCRFGSERD
ncbi:hypothetical protein KZZ52_58430 [Dactylosporangium sp. AC04546]|uniref:hypothetical protein n=1 Tax=Dactylosporangium sp. AC04546 TaxID=2862460 RepID=UPI001EDF6C1F|nr:hypothetical protein [Dactylosporangium sp. AC04546]WVK83576.1 hypothetical protein KZZ52_58430 [Dactylosporangium sp. AC04546]